MCVSKFFRRVDASLHQHIADTFAAVFSRDIELHEFNTTIGKSVRRIDAASPDDPPRIFGDPIGAAIHLKEGKEIVRGRIGVDGSRTVDLEFAEDGADDLGDLAVVGLSERTNICRQRIFVI